MQKTQRSPHSFVQESPPTADKTSKKTAHSFFAWGSEKNQAPPLNTHQIQAINQHKTVSGKSHTWTPSPLMADYPYDPETEYDDSLENMRDMMHEFVVLATDEVYTQYINDSLQQIQHSTKTAAETVKSLATWIIKIKAQATLPLMQTFSTFDPSKSEIEPHFKRVLQILKKNTLEEEESGQLRDDLKVFLAKNLEFDPTQDELANPNLYIETVLNWIFNGDQTKPLAAHLRSEVEIVTVQKVFEQAILFLVEKKVDEIADRFEKTIQNRFPLIVKKLMQTNAAKITDLLSGRLAEAVTSLGDEGYKQTFDNIVSLINNHAKRIAIADLAADKEVKKHVLMIKEAKEKAQIDPSNEEEVKVKEKCLHYLNTVEARGGIEGIRRDCFERAFMEQSAKEIGSTNPNDVIANKVIDILFPSNSLNDGLLELLQELKLPEEANALWAEMKELGKEILDTETIDLSIELGESFKELITDAALKGGRELLQIGTSEVVKVLTKKLSSPKQIEELMSDNILPAVYEEITSTFAKQVLWTNVRDFEPLFTDLANNPNPDPAQLNTLYSLLYRRTLKEFSKNAIKKQDIDEETFTKLVSPFVQSTLETLKSVKENKTQEGALTAKETKAVFKELLDAESQSDPADHANLLYSDTLINLLFDIGGFGAGTKKLLKLKFMRKAINRVLINSIGSYRTSHHNLIDIIANSARPAILNKEKIKELFTFHQDEDVVLNKLRRLEEAKQLLHEVQERLVQENAQESEEYRQNDIRLQEIDEEMAPLHLEKEYWKKTQAHQEEVKRKIDGQFAKVARISTDIALFNMKRVNIVFKFVAKWIFGVNEKRIHKVITQIYQRVLGRQDTNLHLMDRILMTVLNALGGTQTSFPATYSISPKVPVQPPQIKRPFAIKKTGSCFRSVFGFLGITRVAKLKLSEKQIRLMNDVVAPSEHVEIKRSNLESRNAAIERSEAEVDAIAPQIIPAEENVEQRYDDSVQRMRQVATDIAGVFGKVIYEEYVEKELEKFQELSLNFPDYLKKAVDFCVIMLNPTYQSLRNLIAKYNLNMPLDSQFKFLLKALNQEDFLRLEDALGSYLVKKGHDEATQLKYTHAILNWLKNAEHISLVDTLSPTEQYNEKLLEEVSTEALKFLIHQKSDTVAQGVNDFIQGKLPAIVEEMIEKNMQEATSILTAKLGDLLLAMSDGSYTQLIDQIAGVASQQVNAFHLAEHDALIPYEGEDVEDLTPQLVRERTYELLFDEQDIIHPVIQKFAIPTFKSSEEAALYQETVENEYYRDLANQLIEIMFPSKTVRVLKDGVEETVQVDELAEVVKKMMSHPELTAYFEDFKLSILEMLPPGYERYFSKIETTLFPIIEKFAVRSAKTILSQKLAEFLKSGMKSALDTNSFNRLLGEDILPPTLRVIIPQFVGMMIDSQKGKAADLLERVMETNDPDQERLKIGRELYGYIKHGDNVGYKNTGGQFNLDLMDMDEEEFIKLFADESLAEAFMGFVWKPSAKINTYKVLSRLYKKWIKTGDDAFKEEIFKQLHAFAINNGSKLDWDISGDRFKQWMNSSVERMKGAIDAVQKSPNRTTPLSKKEIAQIIKNQIDPAADGPAVYVDLLLNVMRVGEFNPRTVDFLNNWLYGILKKALLPAVQPLRGSHRKMMHGILNGVQSTLNEERIRSIVKPTSAVEIDEEEEDAQAEALSEEVGHQFDLISRILYDIIYFKLPMGTGYPFQLAAGKDHTALRNILMAFKEKYIDDPLLKQNLLLHVNDALVVALKDAAEKVSKEQAVV